MSFDNTINFLKTLPAMYADNVKSDNAQVQKAIDWAPSLIMATGMVLAPYAGAAIAIATIAGNHYQPEIITNNLIKNVLFAASLAIGVKSILPVAKALLYSATAIISVLAAVILLGVSANFDALKDFTKLIQDKNYGDAKVMAFQILEKPINEITDLLVKFRNFLFDQFLPKTI